MQRAVWKWGLVLGAMFVAGPLAAKAVGSVHSPGGSDSGTMLISESPLRSVLLTLVALLLAGVVGMLAAWRAGLRTGLFVSGVVVAWSAWSGARIDEVIRESQSAGAMWQLAIEGGLLGVIALGMAFAMDRISRSRRADARSDARVSFGTGLGLVVGLVVGGGAAWAVGRSTDAGQALAAATVGALVATVVGRVVDVHTPTWSYVSVITVLAVAGPASAGILHDDRIVEATYAGHLLPLARMAPLDWIAGALLGVPLGSAWAASMIERSVPSKSAT